MEIQRGTLSGVRSEERERERLRQWVIKMRDCDHHVRGREREREARGEDGARRAILLALERPSPALTLFTLSLASLSLIRIHGRR